MPEIFDASAQAPKKKESSTMTKTEPKPAEESEANHSAKTKDAGEKKRQHPRRHAHEYSAVIEQELPSSNPLHAFAPLPVGIEFDSQASDEQILLLLRKSPITQIRWVLIALMLSVFPVVFSIVPLLGFLPDRFEVAGLILWYLLVTGYVLESILSWFFNVYIVTDERIIDVDFLSLIYKNITTAKIDNIEDITAETGGALRSIFNFGTVKIQTAGTAAEIAFEDVPQPAKVTRLLNELLLEEEREKVEGRVN